jgi:hypothetical protein
MLEAIVLNFKVKLLTSSPKRILSRECLPDLKGMQTIVIFLLVRVRNNNFCQSCMQASGKWNLVDSLKTKSNLLTEQSH